jgi:hypothetical protein
MKMIGHDDKGVKPVAATVAVMEEQTQKEICIVVALEERLPVGRNRGDKECLMSRAQVAANINSPGLVIQIT